MSKQAARTALQKLEEPYRGQNARQLMEFNSMKNNLLDRVLAQEEIPTELGRRLIAMYYNTSYDPVWRDYVVQHLADWVLKASAQQTEDVTPAIDALWGAARGGDATIAGSALIGLGRLSAILPKDSWSAYQATVAAYASSSATAEPLMATALQLASGMGRTDVLPSARRMTVAAKSMALRLSSIAVLGDLGDAGDRRALSAIVSTASSPYERRAAEAALVRLNARLAGE
jgi:hypothetical protein